MRLTLKLCVLVCPILLSVAYAQVSDTTPATLISFTFSPAFVDTRSGPKNVTFTAEVSDDLSGVSGGAVALLGPNNQPHQIFFTRTGGNAALGKYTAVWSASPYLPSGEWRVYEVAFWDQVGNYAYIGTNVLKSRNFPTILTVTSSPDTSPPQIQSLQFSPAAMNVSAADAAVTVRMRLTDNLAGVAFDQLAPASGCNCLFFLMTLASPSGKQTRLIGNTHFQLISGDRLDGIWEAIFIMPRFSEPGTWTVQGITINDAVNNTLVASTGYLNAAGLPTTISVASTTADLTPPTVTSLTRSRTVVDTSAGPQNVTFTFGLQDDISGVKMTREPMCACRLLGIRLISPSETQNYEGTFHAYPQVSGNALNGTWTVLTTIPQYVEAGTWGISLRIRDQVFNERTISPSDLRALGLPSTIDVIRPSYERDGSIGPAGGTVVDQVFGSHASISIPKGALPGDTELKIDVLPYPPNIPSPQGFSAPATKFVNFDLVPHPSAPIGPPGYTITIPLLNTMTPGTAMTLFRLDPYTGNLVNARSVSAGAVTGTVDTSGQTATFTGIASFSTVVGMISSGQKPGDLDSDGIVNCADVLIVRKAFGKRQGELGFDARADVNRDGVVGIYDLSFVLRLLPAGTSCP